VLLHHQLLATQEVLLLQDQEDHLAILLLQEVHPPPLQDMLVPHLQLTNKVPNPRHQDIPDLLLQATILDNLVLVLDLQPIPIILHSLSLLTNLQLQEVSMDPTPTAEVDLPKDRAILVLHSDCVVLVN